MEAENVKIQSLLEAVMSDDALARGTPASRMLVSRNTVHNMCHGTHKVTEMLKKISLSFIWIHWNAFQNYVDWLSIGFQTRDCDFRVLGPVSISEKTSFRKIS